MAKRRTRWVALVLVALVINFGAVSLWRATVIRSGRADAMLTYKPSPLRDAYARRSADYEAKLARFETGEIPAAEYDDLKAAFMSLKEQRELLSEDEAHRYMSARRIEEHLMIGSFAA